MLFLISDGLCTCVMFLPNSLSLLRLSLSWPLKSWVSHNPKNVALLKNASGWTRTCICFVYPQTEKLLKRLWLIGKWDFVGQKHLKLQLLAFPSGTSLGHRIDAWIVFVLLLIISGWKCLPKHFTGGFRICFPSLQLKGSRRCHCAGICCFIWLNEK